MDNLIWITCPWLNPFKIWTLSRLFNHLNIPGGVNDSYWNQQNRHNQTYRIEMWILYKKLVTHRQRIIALQVFKGLKTSFIWTPKGSWSLEPSSVLLEVPGLWQSQDKNARWRFYYSPIPIYCTMLTVIAKFVLRTLLFYEQKGDASWNELGSYYLLYLLGIHKTHYSIKNSQKSYRKQGCGLFIANLS